MNYTVVWLPIAEQKLAGIWTTAEDRAAASAAANEIDLLLKTTPRSCGESRGGVLRVMFVGVLGVEYELSEEDRLVRVLTVWRV